MVSMKTKKLFSLFSIITIALLLTISFSGCIQKKEGKEKKQPTIINHIEIFDETSILPNWKDGEYHDYKATTKKLNNFNQEYPDLVDVFSIGKSVEDRDIWCIKITNKEKYQDKYISVIDGSIHGNEWESIEICLYFAEYLLINFGENKTITNMLNVSELYLIPMLNPDGREKDMRWNENGIDLNRNFDVHFGRIKGHSFRLGKLFGFIKIPMIELPRKGIYTNAGRRAFSEPETSALRDFMKSLDSEKLSFYVNCHTAVHGVASVINIDFKPEFLVSENEKEVLNKALVWIDGNTEYDTYAVGSYSFSGAGFAHHWVFKEFCIPSFVFELLSQDYEPGYNGGGPHDSLVHWMKASLPVLIFLLTNIENLYNWETPDIEPVLSESMPPKPLK